jgi:hypothetical protein
MIRIEREKRVQGTDAGIHFGCNDCKELKPLSAFAKSNRWSPTGHQYKCKDCFKKLYEARKAARNWLVAFLAMSTL